MKKIMIADELVAELIAVPEDFICVNCRQALQKNGAQAVRMSPAFLARTKLVLANLPLGFDDVLRLSEIVRKLEAQLHEPGKEPVEIALEDAEFEYLYGKLRQFQNYSGVGWEPYLKSFKNAAETKS